MEMMKKIIGLCRLIRFELPLSAGICVILGQLFALGSFSGWSLTLSAFFSVFFVSASILVLNDYFDVESDKINSPQRPIPAGLVTPKETLVFTILLLLAGLWLSYLISITLFFISIVLTLIGFLYNRYFKKSGLPGNLMVSFSVAMTFVFGGASVNQLMNKTVLFFALIAGLVDLGEEIAADAMDMEGDKLINSKSIAIQFGQKKALKLSFCIFFIVTLLTFFPFILKWFSLIYLLPILIMDTAIIYFSMKLIGKDLSHGRENIRFIYLGATFGLIIFLVMKLFGI